MRPSDQETFTRFEGEDSAFTLVIRSLVTTNLASVVHTVDNAQGYPLDKSLSSG